VTAAAAHDDDTTRASIAVCNVCGARHGIRTVTPSSASKCKVLCYCFTHRNKTVRLKHGAVDDITISDGGNNNYKTPDVPGDLAT